MRFIDRIGDPPPGCFDYKCEEVSFTHDGVEYYADVTYQLEVEWEYDSGDWSVGIRDGWIPRWVSQEVVGLSLYDDEGNGTLTPATPEFLAKVVKCVPKLDGHCLEDALRH